MLHLDNLVIRKNEANSCLRNTSFSSCVCQWQKSLAWCCVTVLYIRPIFKLQRIWSVVCTVPGYIKTSHCCKWPVAIYKTIHFHHDLKEGLIHKTATLHQARVFCHWRTHKENEVLRRWLLASFFPITRLSVWSSLLSMTLADKLIASWMCKSTTSQVISTVYGLD